MLNGLVLGDKLKAVMINQSHHTLEWVVSFLLDADILNAYYEKHYANNTESMWLCTPFISKLPVEAISRNYLVVCYNYTPGRLDNMLRLADWEYMWNTNKYPMSAMFTLAGAVFIAGICGEA